MAGIFQRFFKMAQSEAHSAVDKLEDPIKLTEQGIRDLKKDLQSAMTSLAEVKAIAIRLKKDSDDQKKLAGDYERKAMMLLQKAQAGDMDAVEAERLATAALEKKEGAVTQAQRLSVDQEGQQGMADQLQNKVEQLKRDIGKYENELVTLRARAKTASSMRKINQQLSGVDSSSTLAMLEKMKDKVAEEESLAQAYGDIGDVGTSIDQDIDKALQAPSQSATSDSLAELKKKMGIEA